MDTVFLETGTSLEVKVHPVVLFAILDHFVRRHDGQSRVIGACVFIRLSRLLLRLIRVSPC